MTSRRVQVAIDTMQAGKANTRCQEMIDHLESLGFDVRAGKKAGHKIVTHPGLDEFYSDGFTCGHGRNPEIKPVYFTKMVKLIRRYAAELSAYLENNSNGN